MILVRIHIMVPRNIKTLTSNGITSQHVSIARHVREDARLSGRSNYPGPLWSILGENSLAHGSSCFKCIT
jgi:hypothetical protein